MAQFHMPTKIEGESESDYLARVKKDLDAFNAKQEATEKERLEQETKLKEAKEKGETNLADVLKKLNDLELKTTKSEREKSVSPLLDEFNDDAKDLIKGQLDFTKSIEDLKKEIEELKKRKSLLKQPEGLPEKKDPNNDTTPKSLAEQFAKA